MAVTQNSDANSNSNSKQQVEEAKSELTQLGKTGPNRCSDKGPTTGKEGMLNLVRVKTYKPRKNRKNDDQDSLSDIDDAEVAGYLNTKEALNCKRILWEALHRNYTQAKKQKRTKETKKGTPVKKAAKTTEKVEIRKPSTKINYDALKLFDDESNQGSETVHRKIEDSPCENISPHESDDDCYNDDQRDTSYGGDNVTFDDSGYGYEDEYENDESFDF